MVNVNTDRSAGRLFPRLWPVAAALFLFLLPPAALYALPMPEKTVTLSVRDSPLENILNEISRQTGIRFSYSPQEVDVSRTASIDAQGRPLNDVLRQLLEDRYEYRATRKFAILRKPQVKISLLPESERKVEKMEYSYITNQHVVKKLRYADSGTTLDDCLTITNNNKNFEVMKMKKHLAAIALATAAGVSAPAQQPSTVSEQLDKAGRDFMLIVEEAATGTAQAVKLAADRVGQQVSSLSAADTLAAAPADGATCDSARPVIFTLCYPFSFPDLHTERHVYNASFTWLCGVTGGVCGVEMGGLVNINCRHMSGVQLAGISNLSLGNVTGVQLAGIANLAARDTASTQLAGIVNIAQSVGFQGAGIANVAQSAVCQATGIVNLAGSGAVQLAGIANLSAKGAADVQLAGIVNAARSAKFQATGIANVADSSGCQVGLTNTARVAGVQVGLVNVCDTSGGVMVGLVNVAKRGGLREFEVSASLADNVSVAYRLGTAKFYSFAEVSHRFSGNLWLTGVGVGTQISLPRNWAINIEGLSQNVLTDFFWERGASNRLAQVRTLGGKRLAKYFAVFAGPSLCVYNTNVHRQGSVDLKAPYTIYSGQRGRIATKVWVGFSAGVRL
ncbi:MAG: hypothetical protein LBH84_09340 [Prevotellaceae bacterium]|jgi:hypothetical protein|nr:hypothetical protein [Prevotellaceae bacterium]